MPIRSQLLEAPENRHLALDASETLLRGLLRLNSGGKDARPWWHLVVLRSDGTWATTTFDRLLRYARDYPERLTLSLGQVEVLVTAQTVERTAIGTAEALDLARTAPGRALVVTENAKLAGFLCASPLRSNSLTLEKFRRLMEDLTSNATDGGEGDEGASGPKTNRDVPRDESSWIREVRYTDVSCPRQVWHATPRFSVVVQLTLEPSSLTGAHQKIEAEARPPVQIDLQAPDFEVLNASRQEVTFQPHADSPPVVFHLKPDRRGDHPLTFDFFQGGDHLGTVRVLVNVIARAVAEDRVSAPTCQLFRETGIAAPDIVLRITRDRDMMRFSLIRDGGSSWQDFEALPLEFDPEQFAAENLRELKYSAHHTPEVTTRISLPTALEIDRRLKNLGRSLWRDLLPRELKRLYARERAEWRDRTLLILSDEPHLPWELVWPYGEDGEDWEDAQPWCLTLRLSRWLRRDPRGDGNARSPGRLSMKSLACLAPTGSNLPAAQEERDLLHRLMKRYDLDNASPPTQQWEPVTEWLEAGTYDWLHVAAHGSFHSKSPDQYAALWLEDGHALAPNDFVGSAIEGHLSRVRPAFFFNACHAGRQGWTLTRLGGWANRLLSSGAGLFLGPFWAVDDRAALVMAKFVYSELLAGETVAEACRRARRAARRAGDPSWLAYSLYAHPNARLEPKPT